MASTIYRLRQFVIVCALFVSASFLWNGLKIGLEEDFATATEGRLQAEGSENSKPLKLIVTHSDNEGDGKTDNDSISNNSLEDSKCNIPHLDINGSEVIGFFEKHQPLKCQLSDSGIDPNWVFIDDEGKIRFIEKRKTAKCFIRYFRRFDDNRNEYDKPVNIFDGDVMTNSDFGVVACAQGTQKWKSLLWTVAENKEAHLKALKQKEMRENSKLIPNPEPRLNVYFLGFDSLSQMSFRRKLPKTVKFLEEVLGSVVLNGYNIVGDGTPQAFIPILTAKTEVELPLTRKRYPNANYVDDVYPFIWKNFSDAGYMTMYGEDAFAIGTFTYRLKGFRKQPADHYTRTLFEQIEKLNDRNCIGSIPLHKMWFDAGRRFMKTYGTVPRFLLMHQSLLSHDDVNLVGVEDDDVLAHLTRMFEEGEFDNSLVVVMADHGHRFAKLRDTHQGQLEERLPFFSFALPKSYRSTPKGAQMYKNLVENKEKLTSPFDIHATLMDILNPPEDDLLKKVQSAADRSLSLFRPMPDERTCAQAGIEPHWCTCLAWADALTTPEDRNLSLRLAQAVVRAINDEIGPEKELCSPLKLDSMLDSKKLIPNQGLLAYKNVKDADGFVPDLSGATKPAFAHFQLKLRTTPGDAVYEVTLFYEYATDTARFDLAALSHVNKFGDRPHCIIDKNYFLATFCVCYDRV